MKLQAHTRQSAKKPSRLQQSATALSLLAAQCAAWPALAQEGSSAVLEEIIVTARRASENLQGVPVSVQVISGEDIREFAMTSPSELSKLTPGLSLNLPSPSNPEIVLRGVRWVQSSGTPATPVYLNEVSFDPVVVLQTMYDFDRVQVLRGPQGTTRGAPSIAGAITLSTARPDLEALDGYVSGMVGENSHWNTQAAVSAPLIKDKLAVRFAGSIEEGLGNTVTSSNSHRDPEVKLQSWRASLRYQPMDALLIDAMFQRMDLDSHQYTQVAGAGSPGITELGVPAGYNGPGLKTSDYRSVEELRDAESYANDLFTVNVLWDVLGQTLNYNFGSQEQKEPWRADNIDVANMLIGYDRGQRSNSLDNHFYVHELRLSSQRDESRFFDYDLGVYYQEAEADILYEGIGALLDGAFGNPFGGQPSPFVDPVAMDHYTLYAPTDIHLETENYSAYGNLILRLSDSTELSGGLRWIHDTRPSIIAPTTTDTPIAVTPDFGLECSLLNEALRPSPIYDGVCDYIFPAMALPVESYEETHTEVIYNLSLSHQFSDDVLAYATVGTSWRAGLPAISNEGLPSDLLFPQPEEATSYEIGVKSTLGDRLRANAAIFQLDYKGQLTQFEGIPYYNSVSESVDQTSIQFLYNVDAVVQGVEAEFTLQALDDLTLGTYLSYSKIESEGGAVPCADDSRPLTAANPINFCAAKKGQTINAAPEFQASVYANYVTRLGPLDAYARLVVSHQGDNPAFGISMVEADSYTLVDLFVGVSDPEGRWDVGLYGKNIFDENAELTRNEIIPGLGVNALFGPPGYDSVTATLPREVGLTAIYKLGSR